MASSDDKDPSEVLQSLNALEAAEQRAFIRGRDSAKLIGEVESHERQLTAIHVTLKGHANEMRHLADTIQQIGEEFRTSVSVAASRAMQAKEAAEKQVSTRTFVLGLIGAVVALGALLGVTGHA